MHTNTHVTETAHPAVPNCTSCDGLLVGRGDGMAVYRVQVIRRGKSWPTIGWLCEPCRAGLAVDKMAAV